MALDRHIHGGLLFERPDAAGRIIGESVRESAQDRSVVRLHASGREGPVDRAGRIPELEPELPHQVALDFSRPGAVAPGGNLRVERGCERVAHNSHSCRGRIEKAVITGMGSMDLVLGQALDGHRDGFARAQCANKIETVEAPANTVRIEFRGDAQTLDRLDVILDLGGNAAPKDFPVFLR